MRLQSWREIAQPHRDVLEGTFQQSEFAADLTQVASGKAPEEYQNPEKFFSRTFITEGMRLLLLSVAKRLSGMGGDPVIQLQTSFGGGKTHTLIAVFHLAKSLVPADRLKGIPPILDEAGILTLPGAKIAVIDGIKFSPSKPRIYEGQRVATLWGELAWQLLGKDGYAMVAESDAEGTSPGKESLTKLFEAAAPCVVLLDELVAFMRQMELDKHYAAGTFDSNLSFIQALTEAMKAVPNAILLASLPESDLEIGGSMGQRALNSLEKYFARVESVWKPVAAEEAFEIVRRRLFENAGSEEKVREVCRHFFDFYHEYPDKFPQETQSGEYMERLCRSYPIHPEIFDRLYEDWSTLEKFQRTRGVLQFMAIVIHHLWVQGNSDAMILPGSIPLEISAVRTKSIHYLPQGWEPVIEKEVDGPKSTPAELDSRNTLFGSVQAARRTARTLFLGSAPSGREQGLRGLESNRILLGAAQPGQSPGVFEDVLQRLRDRLHYLYADKNRFWLDTRPNLRREMESRIKNISENEILQPILQKRLSSLFGRKHVFSGIHVFTASGDVPDDYGDGPRLVVLPTSAGYSSSADSPAHEAAEAILRKRGDQPRQKQNRLIFLAPDADTQLRVRDQGKTYLAWDSIVKDIEEGNLNQDIAHLNQAKRNRDIADKTLNLMLRETWKWLMAPMEDFIKGKPVLTWEAVSLPSSGQALIEAIEFRLKEEEWLISEWSPIHLKNMLEKWYFKDDVEAINAKKVFQDTCHYLYLPRLLNEGVLRSCIARGLESEDFFGFAAARDENRYVGFRFGRSLPLNMLDDACLLIQKDTAIRILEEMREQERKNAEASTFRPEATEGGTGESAPPLRDDSPARAGNGRRTVSPSGSSSPGPASPKTSFYGTVSLNPVRAKMDFNVLMDEVVQQFTARLGVDVEITVEIHANSTDGFDEGMQRSVKENCSVLKFDAAEFDES